MSTERLFLADPYNNVHIDLLKDFEKRNGIEQSTANTLGNIPSLYSKEEFSKQKKSSNDVFETLFIEKDSKIKDSCNIQGEKDRKTCTITYAAIRAKLRNRKLVNIATNYALNALGMQTVITMINPDDNSIARMLEQQGYESLGEESGKIIYISEKEDEYEMSHQNAM